jgi:hypothetical protein
LRLVRSEQKHYEALQTKLAALGAEITDTHERIAWVIEWKIDLIHIQPGKPTQNGGMESCAMSA